MINILYCGNSGVFDGMLLSVLSVAKYTKHPVHVFILTMDLTDFDAKFTPISDKQAAHIEKILKGHWEQNELTLIDGTEMFKEKMQNCVNMGSSYTPYTLLRLILDELPDIPEKIIYMDTDTMAHGDVAELFDIDVSEYEFAGVVDYLGKFFIKRDYINAGVLLLNLKKIKETGLFAVARKACCEKKMAFPDQDAINHNVTYKLIIDTKFNSQRRLCDDTVIQHFSKSIRWFPFFHTINVKPWQIDDVHKRLKIFAYDDIFEEFMRCKKEIEGEK